jgi:nucleoside-diphosphate-sugar epimerase
MMKALITGGSGALGQKLIKKLQDAGHEVVNFDLNPSPGEQCDFFKGDLTDLKSLEKATKGIDVVCHLAALWAEGLADYPTTWDVNIAGSFNVLEASVRNKVDKVVYASSICATGLITWYTSNHSIEYFPVDEEHPCKPQDLYGTGKLIAEELGYMYTTRADFNFTGMRLATIWFKGDEVGHSDAWKDIIRPAIVDPESVFERESTGAMGWPRVKDVVWQYVAGDDAAEAFKLAIETTVSKCSIYNVGAVDTPSEWDSLKIAKHFYPEVPIRNPVAFLIDKKKALWDVSKIQKELGFRPKKGWKEFI